MQQGEETDDGEAALCVAAKSPIATPAQVIAPLAYRIAGTLHACQLASLRTNVIPAESPEKYRQEVLALARSIPPVRVLDGLDEEVVRIRSQNSRIAPVPPGRILYLSAIGNESLAEECIPLPYRGLYQRLRGKHEGLRDLVLACARYDMQNRYLVCRNDLLSGVPCFFRSGIEDWLIVFLGHFHRGWVREFMRRMYLAGPKYDRLFQLVRADPIIFAQAVSALPADPPPGPGQRFFDHFPSSYKRGLAFLYRNPPLAFEALAWPVRPREVAEMKRLADTGLSLSVDEAVEICLALLY
jgi:hypothetical protein